MVMINGKENDVSLPIQVTEREKEIMDQISVGKSAYCVGVILGISEHTVHFHIKNLYKKFGVTSRGHLCSIMALLGYFDTENLLKGSKINEVVTWL